jgi:hypothetical protein
MNKPSFLVLSFIFLCLGVTPLAHAEDTIPNELLGIWSVSKTGNDMRNMFESTNGEKVIWIFKPDANNYLTIEVYGIASMGQFVYQKELQIDKLRYSDTETRISLVSSMAGFNSADSYIISWALNGKPSTGSGSYANYSKIDGMDNVFSFIGAPQANPWTYNGGGTVQLKKISSSQVPPKPKPAPAIPPSYGAPASPMPFMMPAPSFGAPSRSYDYTPQRNTSHCMMNKMTCTNGCDPPSYGLPKDYNQINRCQDSCEDTYNRCMGQR